MVPTCIFAGFSGCNDGETCMFVGFSLDLGAQSCIFAGVSRLGSKPLCFGPIVVLGEAVWTVFLKKWSWVPGAGGGAVFPFFFGAKVEFTGETGPKTPRVHEKSPQNTG